jgi:hypothetical protein
MQFSEFLTPYDREMKSAHLEPTPDTPAIVYDSRVWAERFGHILHDYLAGKEPSPEDIEPMVSMGSGSYAIWYDKRLAPFRKELEDNDDEDSLQLDRELNFHTLNIAMLPAWVHIFADVGEAPENLRRASITAAQDILAYSALDHYVRRHRLASPKEHYDYYSPENIDKRNSAEGKACEYDTGIVLLELMRRNRELVVVAAPPQFEKHARRSADGKSNNVDFVAILRGRSAVGIQVKTNVNDNTRKAYDPERVVLVDGREDLGNIRFVRASHKETAARQVNWGGLISTQRITKINNRGPNAFVYHYNPTEIMRAKFIAKQLVGKEKSYFDLAVQTLDERLKEALQ